MPDGYRWPRGIARRKYIYESGELAPINRWPRGIARRKYIYESGELAPINQRLLAATTCL